MNFDRSSSIIPLANMIDGLLVVDEQGYIVEINSAVKMIFNHEQAVVGGSFQQLSVNWPVLTKLSGNDGWQMVASVSILLEIVIIS